MWRLWHKLFGWQYVIYDFGFDSSIRRVRTSPTGVQYIKMYGGIKRVTTLRNVEFLTK